MKKVCGFLDNKGVFHDSVEKCEESNKNIKIEELKGRIDNIKYELANHLFFGNDEYLHEYSNMEEKVLNSICNRILKRPETFLKLIEEKDKIRHLLDEMEKESGDFKPWYLKLKWWK